MPLVSVFYSNDDSGPVVQGCSYFVQGRQSIVAEDQVSFVLV